MKRSDFLLKVSEELFAIGIDENEIEKQITIMERYLASAGVGEESPILDNEDPRVFAREIYGAIKAKMGKEEPEKAIEDDDMPPEPQEILSEEPEQEFETGEFQAENKPEENIDAELCEDESASEEYFDDDDDMKIAAPDEGSEELGESLEEFFYPEDEPEEGATREFNVSDLASEEEEYEDIYEEEEEYYEEELTRPAGNLIFFWILSVILAPVWIPLLLALGALTCVAYVLLLIFRFLYVPMLVVLILGGSVTTLAELVYSIVKLVTGESYIGLFELGLCLVVAAVTIGLSVVIYRAGTKYAPGAVRNYWKRAGRIFHSLKKLAIKLMEVCSI